MFRYGKVFQSSGPRTQNKPGSAILVRRSKEGILLEHATVLKKHPTLSLWRYDDAFLTIQAGHLMAFRTRKRPFCVNCHLPTWTLCVFRAVPRKEGKAIHLAFALWLSPWPQKSETAADCSCSCSCSCSCCCCCCCCTNSLIKVRPLGHIKVFTNNSSAMHKPKQA